MVPMHSQSLHRRPSDIYSGYDCISTIYTCMNSWKEPFNPYNSSIWIFSLFWLLSWFQACFQSDTFLVSRWQPPYCLCWLYKKSSLSYEWIKNKQVTVLLSIQKARKWCTCILILLKLLKYTILRNHLPAWAVHKRSLVDVFDNL